MALKSGKPDNRRRSPASPPANERTKTRATTLAYEERPGAPTPRNAPFGSSPELIIVDESVGRATLAAIEDALRTESLEGASTAARPPVSSVSEPTVVFEITTFVVGGSEIFSKASEKTRRAFVAARLLHRLPVLSIDEVVRIDVTPGADPKTSILRVWSRVGVPRK